MPVATIFGKVSEVNSTDLNLTSGQTFTGTFEDVSQYSTITLITLINVSGSERCTLTLESSVDDSGTDKHTKTIDIETGKPQEHTHTITTNYFRLIVNADKGTNVNGPVQVIYHKTKDKMSVLNSSTLTGEDDVILTKSVMVGYDPGSNTYNTINSNASGGSTGISVSLTAPFDSFGRLMVSEPFTLFTSKQQTIEDDNFDTKITGGATNTYNTPFPHNNLQVSTSGDKVVVQSKQYVSYQPGKTLVYLITGTLMDNDSLDNTRARIGPFDDLNDKTVDSNPTGNGFFFQLVGSSTTPQVSLVYRTSMDDTVLSPSVSQSDTVVNQSSWNIDTLDGTGVSGFTLDATKRQIFFFMIAWLGVGDVVCGVFNNATFVPCHRFDFVNGDFGGFGSVAYANTGSFPCRYELEATGTITGGPATMRKICCSVSSDSGFTPSGDIFSKGLDSSVTVSSEKPIFSLRLNQTATSLKRVRTTLNIIKVKLLSVGGTDSKYKLYIFKNPTKYGLGPLSGNGGPVWVNQSTDNDIPNSAAEYDITSDTLDLTASTYPYIRIDEGFFTKDSDAIDLDLTSRILTLFSDIPGNSDLFVITAQSIGGGNSSVLCSCQWQEYD